MDIIRWLTRGKSAHEDYTGVIKTDPNSRYVLRQRDNLNSCNNDPEVSYALQKYFESKGKGSRIKSAEKEFQRYVSGENSSETQLERQMIYEKVRQLVSKKEFLKASDLCFRLGDYEQSEGLLLLAA